MTDYPLESLGLQASVLTRLRSLGLRSTGGLQGMIEAAPDDLARFLGRETFATIRSALERISPDGPPPAFRPDEIIQGARLDPAPGSPSDPPDLTLREALFHELQELRQRADGEEDDHRIRTLEARLNELLDGHLNR